MNRKAIDWTVRLFFLFASLCGAFIFSLSTGAVPLPPQKLIAILKAKEGTEYTLLFEIRIPRTVLALAIGGGLSLSGVILQGMFRNPLVEPYTLGIAGGAGVGVALNFLFRLHHALGTLSIPASGFCGALFVMVVVYLLSLKRGVLKIHGLLLTGVMISLISSSFIMLLMSLSRREEMHGIIFWFMGSLEEPDKVLIIASLFTSLLGLLISCFFSIHLNALMLGEEEALHLGINVERTKKALFILASLLTGFSVSVAGIIGFVGLIVPHLMRTFVGRDHRILIMSSFIGGAAFLILCDTIARTVIAPRELPVGVITGFVGGSIFIYMMTRKNSFVKG